MYSPRSVSTASMPAFCRASVELNFLGGHRLALDHPLDARIGQFRGCRRAPLYRPRRRTLCIRALRAVLQLDQELVQRLDRILLDAARHVTFSARKAGYSAASRGHMFEMAPLEFSSLRPSSTSLTAHLGGRGKKASWSGSAPLQHPNAKGLLIDPRHLPHQPHDRLRAASARDVREPRQKALEILQCGLKHSSFS